MSSACLHKPIAPLHVNTLIDVGGEVPVMPFAPSGSRQFGYAYARKSWGTGTRSIWANHGMLAIGDSLAQSHSLHGHGRDLRRSSITWRCNMASRI